MWVNNDINHPFGNGLYHLCMVIWEMVYGIFLPTITLIWNPFWRCPYQPAERWYPVDLQRFANILCSPWTGCQTWCNRRTDWQHNSSQIGLVSDSGFNPSEKNSQLGWFFPICEKIIQPCSKPSTSGAILRVKLEGGWTPWLNVQLCHVWSHTTLKSHVGNAATLMNIFLPRFNASTC